MDLYLEKINIAIDLELVLVNINSTRSEKLEFIANFWNAES